jgi:23S rRNA pseudouridine1911/1915/1917 synthase
MVDEIGSRLLYEDNHLILVNKRCGELVQGDKTGDQPLLETLRGVHPHPGSQARKCLSRIGAPAGPADQRHRGLCQDLEGPGPHEPALRRIPGRKALLGAHRCAAPGYPPASCAHFLQRDPKTNKSRAFSEPGSERKAASLGYEVLLSLDRYHLLELDLHSGRHHQIRAQLQAMGIHIRGDLKYGARRSNPTGGISLHARSISFEHPVGARETVKVVADPRPVQDDPLWKKLEIYNSI